MKLSVEYVQPKPADGSQVESNIEITCNLITHAILKQHPEGLDGNGPVRRMFGRLQRKMDAALDAKENVLDLEQGEIDMIAKALTESKFPTGWSRLVMQLEDAVYSKDEAPKAA